VVWNVHAGELWLRTTIALHRAVDKHRPRGAPPVRVSFGKVAEYQRRGVVHYHAILRLDGAPGDGDDPDAVLPPPDWASVFVLAHALRHAVEHTRFQTLPTPTDWPAGRSAGATPTVRCRSRPTGRSGRRRHALR
jgi:hypothetical protein